MVSYEKNIYKFILLCYVNLNKIAPSGNSSNKYPLNDTVIFLLSCCVVSYLWPKKSYGKLKVGDSGLFQDHQCQYNL